MNKNHLLSFSYTQREFPTTMINQDCLPHRDLLFCDEGSFQQESVYNLSESFILENDTSGKKYMSNNKSKPNPKRGWRQNGPDESSKVSNDTIDFLAGNVNKSKVEKFIKGDEKHDPQKNSGSNFEVNFYEDTMQMDDVKVNPNDTMLNSEQKPVLEDISETDTSLNNEYFKNMPNYYPGVNQKMVNRPIATFPVIQFPHPMIPMNIKPQSEMVKIENIFLFNLKNNIPNEIGLWYLSSPWYPMLSGPFSSSQISEMYEKRTIDSNWNFRPIDIFQSKRESDKLLNLLNLNRDDWAEDIQDSALLQYTELFLTSKKLLETNENVYRLREEKTPININSLVNDNVIFNEKTVHNSNSNKRKNSENEKSNKLNLNQPNERIFKKFENQDENEYKYSSNKKSDQNNKALNNETLQLSTTQIEGFMNDTQVKEEITKIEIKHNIIEDDGEWEKVDKKKKKQNKQTQDPSFYLIGNKPTKEKKEQPKPTQKVEIVSGEDLVKNLMPKHLKPENKPNYEAFNVIGNSDGSNKKINNKKGRAKPLDIDVKLGFKI